MFEKYPDLERSIGEVASGTEEIKRSVEKFNNALFKVSFEAERYLEPEDRKKLSLIMELMKHQGIAHSLQAQRTFEDLKELLQ